MSRVVKWILCVVTTVLLVAIVLLYVGKLDIVELKFATYQQANSAGALKNGALPSLLPKSAQNIHSISNLDTNNEVVTFDFGADFDQYVNQQKSAPPLSASALGIRRQGEAFSNPDDLIYIPKVAPDGESIQGSLLVNRKKKRALYFH